MRRSFFPDYQKALVLPYSAIEGATVEAAGSVTVAPPPNRHWTMTMTWPGTGQRILSGIKIPRGYIHPVTGAVAAVVEIGLTELIDQNVQLTAGVSLGAYHPEDVTDEAAQVIPCGAFYRNTSTRTASTGSVIATSRESRNGNAIFRFLDMDPRERPVRSALIRIATGADGASIEGPGASVEPLDRRADESLWDVEPFSIPDLSDWKRVFGLIRSRQLATPSPVFPSDPNYPVPATAVEAQMIVQAATPLTFASTATRPPRVAPVEEMRLFMRLIGSPGAERTVHVRVVLLPMGRSANAS